MSYPCGLDDCDAVDCGIIEHLCGICCAECIGKCGTICEECK